MDITEIRAYLERLPSYMRGKDAERLGYLVELVDELEEKVEGLQVALCDTVLNVMQPTWDENERLKD